MKQWNLAKRTTLTAIAAGCAVFLAGCGGASDGADTTPKTIAPAFKVFGDSLMDSGSFGNKVTIQSSDPTTSFMVFPELVAANMGVGKLCSFFNYSTTTATSTTATFSTQSTCTNYAVAGSRVNNLTNSTSPSNSSPLSILYQIATAAPTLAATDVVMVDGGGNDMADLIGTYLRAGTATGVSNYSNLLGTLLPAATVSTLLGTTPTTTSMATAAAAYAQAAAQALAASVRTHIVAKGVTKVVVVNVPDVTTTPRFAAILAQVEATSGTAKRDATQAAARSWLLAYNTALAQGLAGTNVQLFDLYAEGTRVTNNPAQYNLTNVTTPACPKVTGGTDSLGTATLNLPATVAACNTANLSANIPVGETSANWWQSYGYADNFHPTPALHKLIGQAINIQLAKAGWL